MELNLVRLSGSREEARAIFALAHGSGRQALDFDANRAAVLSPDLTGCRIVHFATHAFLDSDDPELSSIVLCRWWDGMASRATASCAYTTSTISAGMPIWLSSALARRLWASRFGAKEWSD